MKLLIADDEELTRNGLASALDWNSFGITKLCEASDGTEGLKLALQEKPDIVLCDVRMPKMSGIEMLKKIKKHQPDVSAIFMSGYSDKDYLKAAIKLKAVHYIEKPIESAELATAVKNAVAQCRIALRHRTAEAIHSNVAAAQLAFYLTVPYDNCRTSIDNLRKEFQQYYGTDKLKMITTFVVQIEHPAVDTTDYLPIYKSIRALLLPMHLHIIYTTQRSPYIVYHVYGASCPDSAVLLAIAEKIKDFFAPFGNCYIALGKTVKGIKNAFHSYESAVTVMKSSFFFEPGTVLTPTKLYNATHADINLIQKNAQDYQRGIEEKNYKMAEHALALLADKCKHANNLNPTQIRSLYYDLFSALNENRTKQKISSDAELTNHENILELMSNCFSFEQLHCLLSKKPLPIFLISVIIQRKIQQFYLFSSTLQNTTPTRDFL